MTTFHVLIYSTLLPIKQIQDAAVEPQLGCYLPIEDFMVSSTKVSIQTKHNKDFYNNLLEKTSLIARAEGLTAHAIAVEKRKKD